MATDWLHWTMPMTADHAHPDYRRLILVYAVVAALTWVSIALDLHGCHEAAPATEVSH